MHDSATARLAIGYNNLVLQRGKIVIWRSKRILKGAGTQLSVNDLD
jgi:hypothetical protein